MSRIRMRDPVSRYELNSKLAAQDARLDSAMHQMLSIVTRMDQTCKDMRAENMKMRDELRAEVQEIRADGKDTRKTVIVTGIAVVLGVAAFNSSVCSSLVAGFQAALAAQQSLQPPLHMPAPPSSLPPGPIIAAPVH
ncbi:MULTISPECIES: hypothetical protein [unclassified Achromobacter]|uniref:hypothetical protein n=1 Tax=unclassified Achromobacter TaxID=2626865 RepID=UPI0018EA1AEE|nr:MULTISPECIES: hypothetical protein [unclassified Achromobacter]